MRGHQYLRFSIEEFFIVEGQAKVASPRELPVDVGEVFLNLPEGPTGRNLVEPFEAYLGVVRIGLSRRLYDIEFLDLTGHDLIDVESNHILVGIAEGEVRTAQSRALQHAADFIPMPNSENPERSGGAAAGLKALENSER